jgi:hypothetical protein
MTIFVVVVVRADIVTEQRVVVAGQRDANTIVRCIVTDQGVVVAGQRDANTIWGRVPPRFVRKYTLRKLISPNLYSACTHHTE